MSRTSMPAPDLPPPSARPVPRPSRSDGWNILADIEVFIFAVEAELEAMDGFATTVCWRERLRLSATRAGEPWRVIDRA